MGKPLAQQVAFVFETGSAGRFKGFDMDDAERLKAAYKLMCKKCGSENVVIDIEQGIDYGGETGYNSGHISLGCNDCKKNDVYISI